MKKSLILIIIAILTLFASNNLYSDNMHQYFFDLSRQMNSVELKINFLNKAIEAQPLFKEAYEELIKLYEQTNDKNALDELKRKYETIKSSFNKESTESNITSLPVIPVAITQVEIKAQPEISSASTDSQKKIETDEIPTVEAAPVEVNTEISTNDITAEIELPTVNQNVPAHIEIADAEVCPKKENNCSINRTAVYSAAGAAILAASGYYGYKYYQHLKREKTIEFIKKTVYYTVGIAAVSVAGYFTYKYFTKPEKKAVESVPSFTEKDIERFLKEREYQDYEESRIIEPQQQMPIPPLPQINAVTSDNSDKYNINSITYEQLRNLPNCDDLTSDLIVKYRSYLYSQTESGFISVGQLYEIPLINPEVINSIAQYLYIQ